MRSKHHVPSDTKRSIKDIRHMPRQEVLEQGYEINEEQIQGNDFIIETILDSDKREVSKRFIPLKSKPMPTRGKSEIETIMADEVCKCQKQIAAYFAAIHDDLQKILVAVNQIKERLK